MTDSIVPEFIRSFASGVKRSGQVMAMPKEQNLSASNAIKNGGKRLEHALFAFTLFVLVALFAMATIRDFSGPLLGDQETDISIWGQQGQYFRHNIKFFPVPHLDLNNDDLLYPYGMDGTFQGWGLEREWFWAALRQVAGQGPWLQMYFLISILITAAGSYLILEREHGTFRAGAVSLMITFCNYYAVANYPYHQIIAEVHWTLLNLLVDYVLLRRILHGESWSARLVVLRLALAFLNFGMGVGYIFGIAPTEMILSAIVIAGVLVFSYLMGRPLPNPLRGFRQSWSEHPIQCSLLVGVGAVAALCYLPIALQLYFHVKRFDFSHVDQGNFPLSPWRLIRPILPRLRHLVHLTAFAGSNTGSPFAGSPGLSFVLLGATGCFFARKAWPALFAPLAMAALLLFYVPPHHTILAHLPWFGFMRVGGRGTVIYPLVLCLFALQIPRDILKHPVGRIWMLLLSLLFILECGTAYAFMLKHPAPTISLTTDMAKFMEVVHKAPGVAILEWPLCVVSGMGADRLGAYYNLIGDNIGLQQLHEKKVLNIYLPRLHPTQEAPVLNAGWARMLFPNGPILSASGQKRDFLPHEWDFLEKFFAAGDFCGIILYTDLLPKETILGFEIRYGQPVAETRFGKSGRMLFIPKPASLRSRVNPQLARDLRLEGTPLQLPAKVLMTDKSSDLFLSGGWEDTTPNGRWSIGNVATLNFSCPRALPSLLRFSAMPFQRQRVLVSLRGKRLADFVMEPGQFREYTVSLPVTGERREFDFQFELPDAHAPLTANIGNPDPRLLGIQVLYFEILPKPSSPN